MGHYNTPGGGRRWGHLIVEETVAQVVSVLGQGQVASAVIYLIKSFGKTRTVSYLIFVFPVHPAYFRGIVALGK